MATMQSFESLFSNVHRYTWQFSDGFNPTSLSCIAFSVEEARSRLLQYLQHIESLQDEKESVDQQIDNLYKKMSKPDNNDANYASMFYESENNDAIHAEVRRLRDELSQKLPLIDNNIGCYCRDVFDFTPHTELPNPKGSELPEITLGEFISTTEPKVKKVSLVSITSCLDG